MNQEETFAWVEQLLPEPLEVDTYRVGESFPEFAAASVALGGDGTAAPETVAMSLDSGRIEVGLEAEPGTEVRVEFVTVAAGHDDLAPNLVAAAATMVSQDPGVWTPQPGTVMRGLGDHVREGLSARHGLLIVPFLWEKGVPQVHEIAGDGGNEEKKADQIGADGPVSDKGFDYTHPGRLTVPAQLVMITDAELEILDRAAEEGCNGVDELQNYLVEQQVNINDLMR